ncbi:MAG: L-serine ammonia-lyase, iron-sulfur-dependent, subunit alpha [Verrucomicrobiota bacterium]
MKPSIFNDVIGPVMRGPSSSHTAAAHRIGALIRQFCRPENGKVLVEFDRKGSLATTYEGQGSAMGLICGLLGVSILDPAVIYYKELAQERQLDILFVITDFEAFHPNTYKIQVENDQNERFQFTAISTGGGMIEIINLNGFAISIKGDYFETLICFESHSPDIIKVLFQKLKNQPEYSEIALLEKGKKNFLINVKSRHSIIDEFNQLIVHQDGLLWIRQIEPVMPILSGITEALPFSSIDEMMQLAVQNGNDLAELAILYESARAGISGEKVLCLMQDIVEMIQNSIKEGLNGTIYRDRILGHQSHLILEAEKRNRIIKNPINKIIAYVTALMEAKSSMEIIVAAPTAGSAGVLGGVILGIAEGFTEDNDRITRAFLAAGLIGVFIADRYTFAAEEGGCQVECGAASGMASAGLVQLMGGTAREAIDAASMALQNLLGLVCDPVADRVEIPCLGKNILGATNALSSANMSLAGFDAVIPLDEVISAMKSVGESLPSSLCCTGCGGLSITPTAIKLHEKLKMSCIKDKSEIKTTIK